MLAVIGLRIRIKELLKRFSTLRDRAIFSQFGSYLWENWSVDLHKTFTVNVWTRKSVLNFGSDPDPESG